MNNECFIALHWNFFLYTESWSGIPVFYGLSKQFGYPVYTKYSWRKSVDPNQMPQKDLHHLLLIQQFLGTPGSIRYAVLEINFFYK